MKHSPLKIGVLGSGSGTNFEAIAQAVSDGQLPGIEIALVIAERQDAPILEKAKRLKIKAMFLAPGRYKTWLEPAVEELYARILKEHGVGLVALAGFMRVVKRPMLAAFPDRIINIHPSLLPAFPGVRAWAQALEFGAKVTGCTVHFVNDQVDAGPILLQEAVPVLENDTPESLHARIQEKEHVLYPKAIALLAQGKIRLKGRRVVILDVKEAKNQAPAAQDS